MHLAILGSTLCSMLLALACTYELDAGEAFQCRRAGSVGQLNAQIFLSSAHGAEVVHLPTPVKVSIVAHAVM